MPFVSFFLRRLLTGAVVRTATNVATKRLKLSPGAASILFVVLTELISRGTERKRSPKR